MDHTILLSMPALCGLIGLALVFDFLNGQHDAGNAIASPIATGALSRKSALLLSATCNFLAFLIFGLHVAGTMGHGLTDDGVLGPSTIAAALTGAIAWNVFTLKMGIPSSSSHALVGALVGGAIAQSGWGAIHWSALGTIAAAILVSPALGAFLSMATTIAITWMFRNTNPHRFTVGTQKVQILTCAFLSLAHGGNDAQKTMGIIAALLFSQGLLGPVFHVPLWVVLSCQGAITLGTLCGGHAIIGTMGTKITSLKPVQGVASDLAGAIALGLATSLGVPVSSTHTITGAIVGSGMMRHMSAVRWTTTRRIVVAWFLTLPAAGATGAIAWFLLHRLF